MASMAQTSDLNEGTQKSQEITNPKTSLLPTPPCQGVQVYE